MRCEVVVTGGFKYGACHYQLGQIVEFDDEVGQRFVRAGWCRDTETGEVGVLNTGRVSLNVDSVVMKVGLT
jgi:hypothetical protein